MEIYSKRRRAFEGSPSSLRYDFPGEFRNQVLFIWLKAAGHSEQPIPNRIAPYDLQAMSIAMANQLFNKVRMEFCEAHGLPSLPGSGAFDTPCLSVRQYFQSCSDDHAIDIIELAFNEISAAQKNPEFTTYVRPAIKAPEAVALLNRRLQEHAIGFRFEQGKMLRLDSEFLHSQVVEPALRLMSDGHYAGALEEFQTALEHYRHQMYDDCLTNCLKAVESTLSKILELKGWGLPGEAKFDNLFAEVRKRGLFPAYLAPHLGELKKFLQAVAVIRNEEGAHGSGSLPNSVPEHLVAYQIHLTGSAIVFLIRASES